MDAAIVDEVLTATRALVALTTRSLGPLAAELSSAQYRALVVLASRGPQRNIDLAAALEVNPSTAVRMCDRLVRKGLVHRERTDDDRRSVRLAISAHGRELVDEVTARRRVLIAEALSGLSAAQRRSVATALRALSAAVGEIPDVEWPRTPDSTRKEPGRA